VISVIPQYANKQFHQCTVQIPNKVDKRATRRNLLKRHAVLAIEEQLQKQSLPYAKFFVFINKKNIEQWAP